MGAEGYKRLGPPDAVVRLVPGKELRSTKLSSLEGFVLSRVDSMCSLQTTCLLTGLGEEKTLEILLELKDKGLIVVGDPEDTPAIVGSTTDPPHRPAEPRRSVGAALERVDTVVDATPLGALADQEIEQPEGEEDDPDALAAEEPRRRATGEWKDSDTDEECDLKPEIRKSIREQHNRLGLLNIFELLGVPPEADIKLIRKGFFAKSKMFHPDRHFGKKLGPYNSMLHEIFKQMNAGYKLLCDASKLQEYRQMVLQQQEQEHLAQQVELAAEEGNAEHEPVAGEYQVTTRRRPRTSTFRAQRAKALMDLVGQRQGADRPAPAPSPPPPADEDRGRRVRRQSDHRIRAQRVTGALFSRAKKAQQFYAQGKAQLDRGQFLAATASLKLAMTYNPQERAYGEAFAFAARKAGELTAENCFKRGMMEESVGRFDAAALSFVKAAQQNPKGAYLIKAAEAMLWTRDSQDLIRAKDYATKAVQTEPNSVDIRIVAAKVYKAAGMKRNARRELQQALKIEPNNSEVKDLLRKL